MPGTGRDPFVAHTSARGLSGKAEEELLDLACDGTLRIRPGHRGNYVRVRIPQQPCGSSITASESPSTGFPRGLTDMESRYTVQYVSEGPCNSNQQVQSIIILHSRASVLSDPTRKWRTIVDECADQQLNKECEIDAPLTFKADVWQHFGFPVSINEKVKRKSICKSCRATVNYNSGNTSNMRSHLSNRHPEKLRPNNLLPRAEEITRCIGEYMARDLRPFSVVDNGGFRRLVNTLEPKYAIPSRPYFMGAQHDEQQQSRHCCRNRQRTEYGCSGERGWTFPTHKVFCTHLNLASKAGLNVNRASRLLATTVLCDESQPTVSLIVPLKHMIEQSMAQCDEDSSTIAQMKRAILKDFTDRYPGEQNKFLQESTALDPRFRSLHQLNDSQREEVFDRLKLKATQMQNQ
ncbi:hypothetical protein F7725_001567, partial [Dissostichus mawsoni]